MYSVLLPNMNIYTGNGYLLMSLEKVVRKNGFSFLIMKNPCADFLQAGTGTNLHKFFLGLFCQTVFQEYNLYLRQ